MAEIFHLPNVHSWNMDCRNLWTVHLSKRESGFHCVAWINNVLHATVVVLSDCNQIGFPFRKGDPMQYGQSDCSTLQDVDGELVSSTMFVKLSRIGTLTA